MSLCRICHTYLHDAAEICPHCGTPVQSHAEKPANDVDEGPEGLGGWLILVVIFLAYVAIHYTIRGIREIAHGAGLVSLLRFVFGEICAICLVCMFKKSSWFPTLYIAILGTNLGIWVIGLITLLTRHGDAAAFLPLFFYETAFSIIWIIYMLRSKRVKNTFVK